VSVVVRAALLATLAPMVTVALSACTKGPPAPRIAADERRADFGKLWIGEERIHEFTCRNLGDAPLTFGEVRSSCGCLLADFTRADVAPGTSRQVQVKFAADKSMGRVEKELRVATNDARTPWLTFTLAADVAALYDFTPPVAQWKELVLGEPAAQRVEVAVVDGSEVHFGAPPTTNEPGFSAVLIAAPPADRKTLVEVRFDGRASVGTHLFHVVLPGDHPRVAQARIPVEATVRSRLDFPEGDRVDFGQVARTRGARVARRIRHRGATPLALDHPEAKVALSGSAAASGRVELRWTTETAGQSWSLELSIAPDAAAGPLIGRVDVTLPGTDEPVHSLTLGGRIVDR
jgi:hypothetical protein